MKSDLLGNWNSCEFTMTILVNDFLIMTFTFLMRQSNMAMESLHFIDHVPENDLMPIGLQIARFDCHREIIG